MNILIFLLLIVVMIVGIWHFIPKKMSRTDLQEEILDKLDTEEVSKVDSQQDVVSPEVDLLKIKSQDSHKPFANLKLNSLPSTEISKKKVSPKKTTSKKGSVTKKEANMDSSSVETTRKKNPSKK